MIPHAHGDPLDDTVLLENVCAGCAECFAAVFHRYCRQVYAIAYKTLRSQSEAEDIVQDVFLAVFLQQERYDRRRGSVRTWVLQFAYFKSLLRRRYLRIRESQNLEEVAEVNEIRRNSPAERLGMNSAEWANYIESGVTALASKQRRTIELIHMEGYTLQESSDILGESLANTRNLYYRGLKALRSYLQVQTESKKQVEERSLEKKGVYGLEF
jgi:RNA polymerase sigma-70 factor (ECF subfamily)